jgi:hypothetical protein
LQSLKPDYPEIIFIGNQSSILIFHAMETIILKGDRIKEIILAETKSEISRLKEKFSRVPGIAFIGFICSYLFVPFQLSS